MGAPQLPGHLFASFHRRSNPGGLHWSGAFDLPPCPLPGLADNFSPSSRRVLLGAHLSPALPSLDLVLYGVTCLHCFSPIWAQHSVNKHGKGTHRTKVPGAAGDPHLAIQPRKPRPPLERRMGPAPPTPTATGPEPAPRRLPGAPSHETWVRERLNELGETSHVSTGI